MDTKTSIQVVDCSKRVYKDEEGFFVYLDVHAKPATLFGIKAYIADEDRVNYIQKHQQEERGE